jgi:drug/metabolite transporter (DMT)-like permease
MKLKMWSAYIIVCIVWGSTYLAIKVGVQTIPPFWLAGMRFMVAGLLILGYLKFKKIALPVGYQNYIPLFIIGFLLLVIGNGCVVWSEQYISSGFAALLAGTVPLWMALISIIFIKSSEISTRVILGILLGFTGMLVLVEPGIGPFNFVSLKGIFGMLIAAISWSFGSIYTSRIGKRYDALVLAAFEMLFAGPVLLILALCTESFHPVQISLNSWWALGYLIIFGSCITLSAYAYLMGHGHTPWASTYAYVNPVIAVFLGWLILYEPITWNIWVGGIIILIGISIVHWEQFSSSKKVESS